MNNIEKLLKNNQLAVFALVFSALGLMLLVVSRAVSPFVAVEVESASLVNGATVKSDATASGSQYAQFGITGGGGSVGGLYGTVGVVGCSNTGEHAQGYAAASTADHLWPITRVEIGGGDLKSWYDSIGRSGTKYWDAFNAYVSNYPPDAIWWQLCLKAGQDPVPGMNAQQQAQLTGVANEIKRIVGNKPIIISPLNSYDPDGICSSVGTVGVQWGYELSDWAVAQGIVELRGPNTGPVNASMLESDLCHLGPTGEAFVGQQMVDFFD